MEKCIKPNAFGNALGSSLAQQSTSGEEGQAKKSFSEQIQENKERNTPSWLRDWQAKNGQSTAPAMSNPVEDQYDEVSYSNDDAYDDESPRGPNAGDLNRFGKGKRIPGTNLVSSGKVTPTNSMEEVSGMSVPAAMGSGAKAVKYTIGNEVRYGYLTPNGDAIVPASGNTLSDRSETVLAYDAKVQAGTYNLSNELSAVWSGNTGVVDKLSGTWTLMTYERPDALEYREKLMRGSSDPRAQAINDIFDAPMTTGIARMAGANEDQVHDLANISRAVNGLITTKSSMSSHYAFLGNVRPSQNPISSPTTISNDYLANRAGADKMWMGIQYENIQGTLDHFITWDGRTTTQLYMRAFDGKGGLLPGSVRMDRVGMRADGRFDFIDYKLSTNAPWTDNQELHYPAFAQYGGVITGLRGKDIGLPKGTVIPPTPIIIQPGPIPSIKGRN